MNPQDNRIFKGGFYDTSLLDVNKKNESLHPSRNSMQNLEHINRDVPTKATYIKSSVWTSPFEMDSSPLEHNSSAALTTAITAAAEAESHVRRGIMVANHWWPALIHVLKHYFAVSHESIWKKFIAFFFPPFGYHYVWPIDTNYSSNVTDEYMNEICKTQNIHHLYPDLYLPFMAFMTYILLYGLAVGTFDKFHPHVLSATASFSTICILLEMSVSSLVFYLIGINYIPVIDILSILGLKFNSLVVILFFGLVCRRIRWLFWGVFLYSSACAIHATFRWLKKSKQKNLPHLELGPSQPRNTHFNYSSLILSLLQIGFIWILTPPVFRKDFFIE